MLVNVPLPVVNRGDTVYEVLPFVKRDSYVRKTSVNIAAQCDNITNSFVRYVDNTGNCIHHFDRIWGKQKGTMEQMLHITGRTTTHSHSVKGITTLDSNYRISLFRLVNFSYKIIFVKIKLHSKKLCYIIIFAKITFVLFPCTKIFLQRKKRIRV